MQDWPLQCVSPTPICFIKSLRTESFGKKTFILLQAFRFLYFPSFLGILIQIYYTTRLTCIL